MGGIGKSCIMICKTYSLISQQQPSVICYKPLEARRFLVSITTCIYEQEFPSEWRDQKLFMKNKCDSCLWQCVEITKQGLHLFSQPLFFPSHSSKHKSAAFLNSTNNYKTILFFSLYAMLELTWMPGLKLHEWLTSEFVRKPLLPSLVTPLEESSKSKYTNPESNNQFKPMGFHLWREG